MRMGSIKDTKAMAELWLWLDKDPATRSEIEHLVKAGSSDQARQELQQRLSTRLTFGTAGLRAQMGAGFSRMNSLTIIQTSQGLADYLLDKYPNAAVAGVVIGHDERHNSAKFAYLTAVALTFKGLKVWWYETSVHTPLVPFAITRLQAAGGVMITASHNPARDNGYKVYASNGCQINTPADVEIAACITRNMVPNAWAMPEESSLKQAILAPLKGDYIATIRERMFSEGMPEDIPKFVYTPMHGVGLPFMQDALNASGLTASMTVVVEQALPDPDFPTVRFPNPEEKGALDLAIATADRSNICLVLANDPDADRFAVAEKVNGHWHQFSGDQVGVLLAYHCFQKIDSLEPGEDYMLTTAVSSEMLYHIAEEEGFSVLETLTGFKWLGNETLALRNRGKRVHFAYEEALGYMFPEVVLDKDGIVAAMTFISAVGSWGSPYAMLQQLYSRYGYFETMNTYWKSADSTITAKLFDRIRRIANPHPPSLGARNVLRWRDLTTGYDSATEDLKPQLPLSKDQMITCWLSESSSDLGLRFTIRASGTEPKIKIYLECQSHNQESAKKGAAQVLNEVAHTWFNDPNLTMEDKYACLMNTLI